MKIVGTVIFGGHELNIYDDLDEPLFMAVEVAKCIDYSVGNTHHMLDILEHDEKVLVRFTNTRSSSTSNTTRGRPYKWFITEMGLYNVLAQSRKPIARQWRRVVHQDLIKRRKEVGMLSDRQFEIWQDEMDEIWFDEETGILMTSRTVQGGDVEVFPYFEDDRDAIED